MRCGGSGLRRLEITGQKCWSIASVFLVFAVISTFVATLGEGRSVPVDCFGIHRGHQAKNGPDGEVVLCKAHRLCAMN